VLSVLHVRSPQHAAPQRSGSTSYSTGRPKTSRFQRQRDADGLSGDGYQGSCGLKTSMSPQPPIAKGQEEAAQVHLIKQSMST